MQAGLREEEVWEVVVQWQEFSPFFFDRKPIIRTVLFLQASFQ